ncbi:relaxase/mobilization nuclease [Streptomyces colonosanans]|uniref:Relaxase/mobilization nuclease n=1 Tax=Streptomyces colonosanans TaxID=1428652 RepID=A0A1S2PD13_9ACTN|nr:relaxase/mobilization nuclease [Streptomyces colonosanans]OIJ91623.1 relaxase/mobilization nuclease [Streptomyces colonosanans]
MIPRLNVPAGTPLAPLSEALGRAVTGEEGLTEHTVVAYWPGLDFYTLDDEQAVWTAAQWAEHLEGPLFENPFTASPRGDRQAIAHIDVRLHPDDRDLSGAEWAEVAHRLARAAGIEIPGDAHGCRWIAVQAKPGRLDLIANLLRLDSTWQHQPANLLQRLSDEARSIEQDLHLTPVTTTADHQGRASSIPTASAQLTDILAQLADERSGPLATVRGLIEHTAHRAALQPGTGPDTAHRLELIARRLHSIQHDLDTTATRLTTQPHLPTAAAAPAPAVVRASARRSP